MAAQEGASAQIEAMARAARQVDQASQTLANLNAQVANVASDTSAGYRSQGATILRGVMEQWNQDMQRIIAGCNQMTAALSATGRTYQNASDSDAASANAISAALNSGGRR